jgi:hypothetical protein
LKIRFIYQGSIWLPDQEKVAIKLCECVAQVIELPNNIELEFANLAPNVYGETLLFGKFKNRFRISDSLSPKEIIKPIVHELIHVHQVHVGKLSVMRDGTHIWMGRQYRNVDPNTLENSVYNNLPWEQDVLNNIDGIISHMINSIK